MYKKKSNDYYLLINILITILFFVNTYLIFKEIVLCYQTVIPLYIPIIILLASGFILVPINGKFFEKYYGCSSYWHDYIANTLTISGIIMYLFIAINFYCHSDKSTKKMIKFPYEYGYTINKSQNCEFYTKLTINGIYKYFDYDCSNGAKKIKNILITTRKGYFGYDIIVDYKINKEKTNLKLHRVN